MASATRGGDADGVRFIYEDDGRITAVDEEPGVASFGETKAEALHMLADALELHEQDETALTDSELDAFEVGDEDLPEFMQ